MPTRRLTAAALTMLVTLAFSAPVMAGPREDREAPVLRRVVRFIKHILNPTTNDDSSEISIPKP
jgi:hypothetical protein